MQIIIISMPGTYSQIYIQIVFAVKGRENLIGNSWNKDLHKYIAGIIKSKDQLKRTIEKNKQIKWNRVINKLNKQSY